MQRPGRVGRDKLHHHAFALGRLAAIPLALRQDLVQDLLFGLRGEFDVDETRPGNVDRVNPFGKGHAGQQRLAQPISELTRVELERFGQLHGGRGGQVAMRRHLG